MQTSARTHPAAKASTPYDQGMPMQNNRHKAGRRIRIYEATRLTNCNLRRAVTTRTYAASPIAIAHEPGFAQIDNKELHARELHLRKQ